MTLNEMICHRKSCRSYRNTPVDDGTVETIRAFRMKPLYPDIRVHWDIVTRDQVRCVFPCPWTTHQLIAFYSEEKEGNQENAGFMLQQMDLYLQTLGLGACWLGIGRMRSEAAAQVDGMKFVILLAFGYPKGDCLRQTAGEFKRKAMDEITDAADPRLEPARLAPSAVNGQPWYFVHEGSTLHVYCSRKGGNLDVGIALAHLYVANEDSFRFCKTDAAAERPGWNYVGSCEI